MDNMGATLSSQTSPNTGNPINPLPIPPLTAEPPSTTTIESIVSTPLEPVLTTTEPVGQTNIDGNVQAHFDVNYQAHDVALAAAAAATKPNVQHQSKTGLQTTAHHKLDIDDSDDHLDKSKSCCASLNKLILTLAIVCFALLLCTIAFIIISGEKFNGKYGSRYTSRIHYPSALAGDFGTSELLNDNQYFNLTHPSNTGIIVVLSRQGASVHDILIPSKVQNNGIQYRSIVVKGGEENHFGSVRFGFDDPQNSMDMTYKLPAKYPLFNAYKEEWKMFADESKPYRVRFARDLINIVYEFTFDDPKQFLMTTMVAPASNEKLIVDPTNNIYFNLRGHGYLNTHNLELSAADPIDISTGQIMEQGRLSQPQQVDRLTNANNYFYKLAGAGIGKYLVSTLSESETKTKMHLFSDHAGVRIDPFGVGVTNQDVNHATTTPDMRGVRISPRQSPSPDYESLSIYGPISVVYPSQAIHTTWWQFEYEN